MKKIAGAAAAALMMVTALAGCGGGSDDNSSGSTGSYCGDLKAVSTNFIGLSDSQLTQDKFKELQSTLHTIADEAPSDVKPDWMAFSSVIDSFSSALDKAGLTFDDLQNPSSGSISPSQIASLANAAKELGTPAFTKAQSEIAANAKSVCNVDLKTGS